MSNELDRLAYVILGAGVDWEQAMAELDNDELDGDSAFALRWIRDRASSGQVGTSTEAPETPENSSEAS